MLFLCFLCGVSYAQESTDFSIYMDTTGKNAVLFRGKRAFNYNMRYNGHCYWQTPEFQIGEIDYNGKHYEGVLMNIDAHRGEVLVKSTQSIMPIALITDAIDRFSIDGEQYVRPEGERKKGIPDGFYQVLGNGDNIVYKKVHKNFTSNTNNNNGIAIGYEDPNYDVNVVSFFQYNVRYYILGKDGVLKKIGKRKAKKLAGRL